MYNFNKDYNDTKSQFETKLSEFISTMDYYPRLNEAMQYSVDAGGKRLRPVLMMQCAKMIGLEINKVLPLALAIEMVHTYSLIHDDLPCMDDDDLRRGKPTNHKVFGEDMAVLAGDGLLNLAMETALSGYESKYGDNYVNAVKYLFNCTGPDGMIGGQVIDIEHTGKFQSLDELKIMHKKKTGALFNACCICPALILGSNNDIISCLQEYSDHLGLLFQVKDDILDVIGDQKQMGKTLGKDEASNKSTFISLLGLDESINYSIDIAEKAKSPLKQFDGKNEFLLGLIKYILERNN